MASVYLTGCASVSGTSKIFSELENHSRLSETNPVNRFRKNTEAFSGDNPHQAHQILWNKPKWIESVRASHHGKLPEPSRRVKLAIVGGGMSGLISAYMLKDFNPVLLEQAPQFGGNSRGESWMGMDYGIGAAYANLPEPDSEIFKFWREIGVDQKGKTFKGADPAFVGNQFYKDPWDPAEYPATGPLKKTGEQLAKIMGHFQDLLKQKDLPEVPYESAAQRKLLNHWDKTSLHKYLTHLLGGPMEPQVEELIESYCWTAFAASSTELSAAAGLDFLLPEFIGRVVFPAGNGTITEGIFKKLHAEFSPNQLLSSTLVYDVQVQKGGVVVSYVDSKGKVDSLHADQVIMSCPKFVVAKIVQGLEPRRLKAIHDLKYRSYLVGNALIDQPLEPNFHDMYFFDGKPESVHPGNVERLAKKQRVTDAIHGCLSEKNSQRTILTLSRGFPYDAGRSEIYSNQDYSHWKAEFKDQLIRSILPLMKISPEKLVDVRVTRWGHPLPVPTVGVYARGQADLLRMPFKDRIYFVEQDNWALPCFETAFGEATYWTGKVREKLS